MKKYIFLKYVYLKKNSILPQQLPIHLIFLTLSSSVEDIKWKD